MTPLVGLAFHTYFPSVGLYSHPAKGQSQTRGVDSAICFLFNLRVFVRNGFPVLAGDAWTVVLDKSEVGCYTSSSKQQQRDTINMKRIMGSIVFITIMTSGISFANPYHVEINASRSGLEARFDVTRVVDQGTLTAGIGYVYEDNHDDYRIGDVKLTLGDEIIVPGLRCDLGFKGLLGEVEKNHKDGDLMAIGFLLSAAYKTPKRISPIPLEISGSVCAAPAPLSFSDSERYFEARASVDFYVVENGAIVLGYRHIKVRIDDDPKDWDMSDRVVSFGFRLGF